MRTRSKNGERELTPEADEWRAMDKTVETLREIAYVAETPLLDEADEVRAGLEKVMKELNRPEPRKKAATA